MVGSTSSSLRAVRWALCPVVVGALVAVSAVACTTDPSDHTTQPTTQSAEQQAGSASNPTSTATADINARDAHVAAARQTIADAASAFALSDAELGCAAAAIADDPETLDAFTADPDLDTDAGARVLTAISDCIARSQATTLLIERAPTRIGRALTEIETWCLTDAYRALEPDDLQALFDHALDADESDTTDLVAAIDDECGLA